MVRFTMRTGWTRTPAVFFLVLAWIAGCAREGHHFERHCFTPASQGVVTVDRDIVAPFVRVESGQQIMCEVTEGWEPSPGTTAHPQYDTFVFCLPSGVTAGSTLDLKHFKADVARPVHGERAWKNGKGKSLEYLLNPGEFFFMGTRGYDSMIFNPLFPCTVHVTVLRTRRDSLKVRMEVDFWVKPYGGTSRWEKHLEWVKTCVLRVQEVPKAAVPMASSVSI